MPFKHERHTYESPSDLIARNSGNLWASDPSCVSIYSDWSKTAEFKQRNRGGGKTEEREERQLSTKIKIRSRENKPVITRFCYRLGTFIWDEEIHKQRLPEKTKSEVVWWERRPCLDRKWFPAVGLYGRNAWLTLQQPSTDLWPTVIPLSHNFSRALILKEISVFKTSNKQVEQQDVFTENAKMLCTTCQRTTVSKKSETINTSLPSEIEEKGK